MMQVHKIRLAVSALSGIALAFLSLPALGGAFNAPPLAFSEVFVVSPGVTLNDSLNATDPDPGDDLSFLINAAPAHGILVVQTATGAFSFTGAAGFTGIDMFTWHAQDLAGASSNTATAVLYIGVDPPNGVPEPVSLALVGLGLGLVGLATTRKRKVKLE